MTLSSRRLLTAALALAAWLGATPSAMAVQYETDVDIDNETDLYDLASRGEISADTLETLVELLNEGVDLNTASREVLYELPGLTFEDVDAILKYREQTRILDPADLVAAGAITQDQLLHIAVFLILGDPSKVPFSGRVRMMANYSSDDPGVLTTGNMTVSNSAAYPPAFLQAKAKGPVGLSGGLGLATTRLRMSQAYHDLNRDGLVAHEPAYSFHVPKYWLQWKNSMFQVLAGSFRIGFGQKLTLDNTTRSNNPDGAYADEKIDVPNEELKSDPYSEGIFVTRDFSWRESLRGLALSVRHIPLGGPELNLHGFGSYQTRSIYQYEVYDRALCEDPHESGSSSPYPTNPCKAPPIGVAEREGLKFVYATMRDAYDELAAGGNLNVEFNKGTHVGVSGYYAQDFWRDTGPIKLDFQEWSNRPYGGYFGAVGVDGAANAGRVNLFGEVTRTFNAMPGEYGGGGWGALGRIVGNIQKTHEVEGSLRWYDRNFVNPLARPMSNPDEFDGQRARNEAGVRVKYTGKPTEDWRVRAAVDFSLWPENGRAQQTAGYSNIDLYLRTDFVGWRRTKLSLWVEYDNKDLGTNGRGQCYDYTFLSDEDGSPIPCFGEFIRLAGAVSIEPLGRKLAIAAQYKHDFVDDRKYANDFRQDILTWVQVSSAPLDYLVLRWRLKYLNESIDNNQHLEQSLWSYLDVGVLPMGSTNLELHVRYDLFAFLDERASTLGRPSPLQHRFRLELEARF